MSQEIDITGGSGNNEQKSVRRKTHRNSTAKSSRKAHIVLKVHRRGAEVLVAACDKNLVGKRLKDDMFDVVLTREFYEGMLVSDEEFVLHMRLATIANLFGKHTVGLGISAGFIDKDAVLNIAGVPHAQMVTM